MGNFNEYNAVFDSAATPEQRQLWSLSSRTDRQARPIREASCTDRCAAGEGDRSSPDDGREGLCAEGP